MSWFEYIFCCCSNSPTVAKKNVTIGVFGPGGAGKTTLIKMLIGEDPREVLSTNGFSSTVADYNKEYQLTFYDVGGAPGIRGIWVNYYGDAHGIVYLIDNSTDATVAESLEAMQSVIQNPKNLRKPFLFVVNDQNNRGFDDVEVSNAINEWKTDQQTILLTHITKYNGVFNGIKRPTMGSYARAKKDGFAFQDQFITMMEKINDQYASLNEGVRSSELARKIRQEEDREKRRMILIKQEHDALKADIAGLVPRSVPIVQPDNENTSRVSVERAEKESEVEDESRPVSLASSTIPSDIIQGSPEVSPPPGEVKISQTSTKPVTPEEPIMEPIQTAPKDQTFFSEPIKSPGRQYSRMQRIQHVLASKKVVPI